jgi:hypothetical protein
MELIDFISWRKSCTTADCWFKAGGIVPPITQCFWGDLEKDLG